VSTIRLILASGSPRRRQLLAEAGYLFDVVASDVDESDVPSGLHPGDVAELLAVRKAQAVGGQFPDAVVLAADTVVAYGSRMLGKPADAADARFMLQTLGGTAHSVITGVAVVARSRDWVRHARVLSAVHMRQLTADEIDRYIATNDWRGKAGGYGIQDDDPFVTRISGCHTNIVGLPMTDTIELLREAGIEPATSSAK
jgi:nucleoside triphosphate pyrophosphatase